MTTATQQKPTSRLGAVRRGKQPHALRYFFYGPEGVGKSTLAANSESPIILDLEGGADQLDVARYTFRDDEFGHVAQTLAEVTSAISDLRTSEHEFKTLIIDTVGSLETLIWDRVCEKHSGKKSAVNKSGAKVESIEMFGYGAGYNCAVDEFRSFCHELERLRLEKAMTIILLGHSMIKTYKNPLGDDYDRIQIRMHEKASGLLKQWCDVVGYCAFEEGATKDNTSDDRTRGFSTGRRLVHLQRSAAYDAKTRIALPDMLEMEPGNSWAPFAAAVADGQSLTGKELTVLINKELQRIGDNELAGKVTDAVTKAKGETSVLSQYLNNLKTTNAKEAN